jgi:hypothetical protein
MATKQYAMIVLYIWILTGFSEVPQKDLILRCCLIHLKNSSILPTVLVKHGYLLSRKFKVIG